MSVEQWNLLIKVALAVLPIITALVTAWLGKRYGKGYKEAGKQLFQIIEDAVQEAEVVSPQEIKRRMKVARRQKLTRLGVAAVDHLTNQVDPEKKPQSRGKRALKFLGLAATLL